MTECMISKQNAKIGSGVCRNIEILYNLVLLWKLLNQKFKHQVSD